MKILITAGSSWTKIDDIRILASIFTGKTGLYLAKRFEKKGDSVTLIINTHCIGNVCGNFNLVRFRYFEELKENLSRQLKKNMYDAIIHTAAVNDYKLEKIFRGKISSCKKKLILRLIPTEKLIKLIRKLAPKSTLIQFKLEVTKDGLIDKAYKSLKDNKSDFVVANALEDLKRKYKAFFIDKDRNAITVFSKKQLFDLIYKTIHNFNDLV
ncbi:MAG: hypothetical protein NC935_07750 [Candidatus Omnitrophica bacterium]|nr:hypothetical protein [Candidatus Omnitrophota bacterium]